MKIEKVNIPQQSILASEKFDYIDSFKGSFVDKENKVSSLALGKAFFSSAPKWVDVLFTFRNKIVSFLGLKTSGKTTNRTEILNNFQGKVGEQIGLFKVFHKSDNEIVLGENDKHLDFRVSLLFSKTEEEKKDLFISTTVIFHNWLGKLYFLPVKPFHKFIVPTMLKGIIQEIEKETL